MVIKSLSWLLCIYRAKQNYGENDGVISSETTTMKQAMAFCKHGKARDLLMASDFLSPTWQSKRSFNGQWFSFSHMAKQEIIMFLNTKLTVCLSSVIEGNYN